MRGELRVLLLALLVAAASADQCEQDADCAPASCCHSTMCVPATTAPKCSAASTSACECAPFTLDCGGTCKCNVATKKCEGHLSASHESFFSTKHKRYGYMHVRVKGKPHNHGGTG